MTEHNSRRGAKRPGSALPGRRGDRPYLMGLGLAFDVRSIVQGPPHR
ncbi:hypothetical protein [Micromonospora sp. NPDC048839]